LALTTLQLRIAAGILSGTPKAIGKRYTDSRGHQSKGCASREIRPVLLILKIKGAEGALARAVLVR
jgi:hypothetical protein